MSQLNRATDVPRECENRFVYTRLAQFINLFLFALVTGIFWGTWFSLSRSIASLAPETFLEVGRTMIQNLGAPMAVLLPVTILSGLVVLFVLYRQRPATSATAFTLALAGLLLLVAALLITLIVNVPIDNQIAQWTPATLPPDWEAIRDRWELWHTVRSFASILGFGCALASALFAMRKGESV